MARRPARRYRPRYHDLLAHGYGTPDYRVEIRRKSGVKLSPAVRSERDSIRSWIREDQRETSKARLRVHIMAEHLRGCTQAEIGRELGLSRLQVHRMIVGWRESLHELCRSLPNYRRPGR